MILLLIIIITSNKLNILSTDRVVAYISILHSIQVAQLSQRYRAAGRVSYGQKCKTGTGRQYFSDIRDLLSTTVT